MEDLEPFLSVLEYPLGVRYEQLFYLDSDGKVWSRFDKIYLN